MVRGCGNRAVVLADDNDESTLAQRRDNVVGGVRDHGLPATLSGVRRSNLPQDLADVLAPRRSNCPTWSQPVNGSAAVGGALIRLLLASRSVDELRRFSLCQSGW